MLQTMTLNIYIFHVMLLLLLFHYHQCACHPLVNLQASACHSPSYLQTSALLSWRDSLEFSGPISIWAVSNPNSSCDSKLNPEMPDHCRWLGVTCNSQGLITDLNLQYMKLQGPVPSQFSAITSMTSLLLSHNNLTGDIPPEIGNFRSLVVLDLSKNALSGRIPAEIGLLGNLQTLDLSRNMLQGPIPAELGNCRNLEYLLLFKNQLSGPIPADLGRLYLLRQLRVGFNNISGSIPPELGNCSALSELGIRGNREISGEIPASLGNLQNLTQLLLHSADLSGSIPPELGNCKSLRYLHLYDNQLSGPIPPELGKLSNVVEIFLYNNRLKGPIPATLSKCRNLQALDLSTNDLTGPIPEALFTLRNLNRLLLLSNQLSGSLSPRMGNCTALARIRLSNNRFGNRIPPEIGNLKKLYFLELSHNQFSGMIPAEIGNCSNLQYLDMHSNFLVEAVPQSLGVLPHLQLLDLSTNNLSGPVPDSLSKVNKLLLNGNSLSGSIPASLLENDIMQYLDLSNNRITGSIPAQIGDMHGLSIYLNFSNNNLSGTLPASISALSELSTMDISHNHLSGNVTALEMLQNLVSLNISHNCFTGPIPITRIFSQMGQPELKGNPGLYFSNDSCAGKISSTKKQKSTHEKIVTTVSLSASIVAGVAALVGTHLTIRAYRIRKHRQKREDIHAELECKWRITLYQRLGAPLDEILKNLVDANIVGEGSSGMVYKVQITVSKAIAVKKLWQYTKAYHGKDSFATEIEVLGSIRHKNIVRLLGFCSNSGARLLMYDYMPKGSLGYQLHVGNEMMEWQTRYRILLGAAQALVYLHHDCTPCIVHRDIKATNILLGPHYEPYLCDFGLAKFLMSSDSARPSNTIVGSCGYVAPECGFSLNITEKCDVYSYGVVMLEVLTGKQPVDPSFKAGTHIVEWLKENLQNKKNAMEVLDPRLQDRSETQSQEMLQALSIALHCVSRQPDKRPSMRQVAVLLERIQDDPDDHDTTTYLYCQELLASKSGPQVPNCDSEAAARLELQALPYCA